MPTILTYKNLQCPVIKKEEVWKERQLLVEETRRQSRHTVEWQKAEINVIVNDLHWSSETSFLAFSCLYFSKVMHTEASRTTWESIFPKNNYIAYISLLHCKLSCVFVGEMQKKQIEKNHGPLWVHRPRDQAASGFQSYCSLEPRSLSLCICSTSLRRSQIRCRWEPGFEAEACCGWSLKCVKTCLVPFLRQHL